MAKGQQTNEQILDAFSGKFIAAIRTHESQRAYLVTDKSVFAAGESIWFNAFLLNSISQKINTKSKFLFVDLVNEKDSVLKLLILDAANLQLNSRIILPDSLPAGYYWLRAYTRQMTEGDIDGICVRPIYVADKKNITGIILPPKKSGNTDNGNPVTTFYPEGGSIMTGVNSTMALKVTDKNGVPLSIAVTVKDSRDTIVAKVTTNAYGLAKFNYEPSGYRKYKAVINRNGTDVSYPLPPFNFYAGQIGVTQQPAGYKLRVLLEDSIFSRDAVSYVIGICKDSLVFAGIGKGLYEVFVGNEKLPDGITTFYLFDKNLQLLSERSVYAHNNNLHINVTTDKAAYAKRDKVTLNISVTDASQHLIPSLVAVSVFDTLSEGINEHCSLPGSIYNDQEIDNMLMALNGCLSDDETDLLMLARNNTYNTLSKNINKQTGIDNDGLLYLTGTAINEKNNDPAASKVLTLLSNSGNPIFYSDTTKSNGGFSFLLKNYADSTLFAVQVKNINGQTDKAKIVFDQINYPKLTTPIALKQYLPLQTAAVKKYINTYYGDELINWNSKDQLPPVKVKYTKKINYDITKRVSSYSTILSADELDENTSLGLSLLKAAGIHMMGGMLVIDGPNSTHGFVEPLLIVDGATVSLSGSSSGVGNYSPLVEFLNGINPKDVDFIEILRGAEAANYGVRGGNGVILVNTLSKRRDINYDGDKATLKKFYAKGITNPVLFPVTDYQKKDTKAPVVPDNRSTLFWNGSYLSDDTHNATITFYTSDIPATYKATVTGITIHGDIIYKTIIFKSK